MKDANRPARPAPELHEVGDGVHAYVQGPGWGFSNAGLVTSDGAALLVDTLYDERLTRAMLDTMRRRVPAAASIGTVVNTHANGDHCWGNGVLAGAGVEIVSSRAAREEMRELPPMWMNVMVAASRALERAPGAARALELLGRLGVRRAGALATAAPLVREKFGAFDFGGVRLTLPTRTFDGALDLQVGSKIVRLLEVGPAHTRGDVLVHVPGDRVVFTGDILFIESHPIVWDGPVSNWIAACDRLLALDVDTVVPGHGPVTDQAGVRAIRDYWVTLQEGCTRTHAAGLGVDEATRALRAELPRPWSEGERLVVNVDTIYRELTGDRSKRDPLVLLARMAESLRASPS